MQTLKGPSLHLAQFSDEAFPFNSLPAVAAWAQENGFRALQIPAWDRRFIDINLAAESQSYCDEIHQLLSQHQLQISELTSHLFGQLMAVHPAYDALCDSFAPTHLHGNPTARQQWADRAGRFRSTGDGQVDFKAIFATLTRQGYAGWATLEWECCLKNKLDGAREGAAFIRSQIIEVADTVFDDFAAAPLDPVGLRTLLGMTS